MRFFFPSRLDSGTIPPPFIFAHSASALLPPPQDDTDSLPFFLPQACVRRRAILSVAANPNCKSKEEAESVVNQVWESCFPDTRPFDEVRLELFFLPSMPS